VGLMSNWDHATDRERDEAREAYSLDDPKHPDYSEVEWEWEAEGVTEAEWKEENDQADPEQRPQS
jgi:hypothetical protein